MKVQTRAKQESSNQLLFLKQFLVPTAICLVPTLLLRQWSLIYLTDT